MARGLPPGGKKGSPFQEMGGSDVRSGFLGGVSGRVPGDVADARRGRFLASASPLEALLQGIGEECRQRPHRLEKVEFVLMAVLWAAIFLFVVVVIFFLSR